MRKSTIEQVITCANYQIKKAQELLVNNEHMWNKSMNLKLYDACGMTKFEKDIEGGKVKIELDNKKKRAILYTLNFIIFMAMLTFIALLDSDNYIPYLIGFLLCVAWFTLFCYANNYFR